jgi:hypothetical protein
MKKPLKAIKVVKMTPLQFIAKYGGAEEKYGEGWEDVVIEALLRDENIQIDFDYS